MKHVNYYNTLVVAIVVVVIVLNVSCRPNIKCQDELNVGLVCEYCRPYKDKAGNIKILSTWDSITVQGIGNDEPLYNNAKKVTKLLLPLHTDKDSTQYSLLYVGKKDTLTIYHTNHQQFASIECGCYYEHDLEDISSTHHWIDSIEVVADTMRLSAAKNVVIWRTR